MIIALVCAIIIMVIEMILFIMRSVQIEESLETPLTAQKSSMAKFRSGALAPDPHFKPDLNFEPPENKEVDKILRGEGPEEIEDASELAETSLQQKKDQ